MFTDAQVKEYAATKGYLPGTILWATDKSLDEDAFRSGNKTSAAIDFLRWQDIGLEDTRGSGRIPLEEQGGHFVTPGRGISLFIKRMLPEGMIYAGTSPEANKSDLMNTLSSIMNAETNPLYYKSSAFAYHRCHTRAYGVFAEES